MLITQRGGEGEGVYDGRVRTSFIVFPRNEYGDLPHEKSIQTNREPVLSRRKKEKKTGIVETPDCTKRHASYSSVHKQASMIRKLQPTERDFFVECGVYILANSGAEVVFHLGVTTGYALTGFVVYWGPRSTALTHDQQFISR